MLHIDDWSEIRHALVFERDSSGNCCLSDAQVADLDAAWYDYHELCGNPTLIRDSYSKKFLLLSANRQGLDTISGFETFVREVLFNAMYKGNKNEFVANWKALQNGFYNKHSLFKSDAFTRDFQEGVLLNWVSYCAHRLKIPLALNTQRRLQVLAQAENPMAMRGVWTQNYFTMFNVAAVSQGVEFSTRADNVPKELSFCTAVDLSRAARVAIDQDFSLMSKPKFLGGYSINDCITMSVNIFAKADKDFEACLSMYIGACGFAQVGDLDNMIAKMENATKLCPEHTEASPLREYVRLVIECRGFYVASGGRKNSLLWAAGQSSGALKGLLLRFPNLMTNPWEDRLIAKVDAAYLDQYGTAPHPRA